VETIASLLILSRNLTDLLETRFEGMSDLQENQETEDRFVASHFGTCSLPDRLPRELFDLPLQHPESVAWLFCTACLQLFEVDECRVDLLKKLVAVPPGYDGPIPPPVLPDFDPEIQYFLAVGGCPNCRRDDPWIEIRIERPQSESDRRPLFSGD